jgi:hypothetical protein
MRHRMDLRLVVEGDRMDLVGLSVSFDASNKL